MSHATVAHRVRKQRSTSRQARSPQKATSAPQPNLPNANKPTAPVFLPASAAEAFDFLQSQLGYSEPGWYTVKPEDDWYTGGGLFGGDYPPLPDQTPPKCSTAQLRAIFDDIIATQQHRAQAPNYPLDVHILRTPHVEGHRPFAYLLSEREDINKIVATFPFGQGEDPKGKKFADDRTHARRLAWRAAANPALLKTDYFDNYSIMLEKYARPDSTDEALDWLYGRYAYWLWKRDPNEDHLNTLQWTVLFPPCRFRIERMRRQLGIQTQEVSNP